MLDLQRPLQFQDIVERKLEDEVVLYDPHHDMIHVLNITAGLVWELCDGDHGVSDITSEIAGFFDLEPSTIDPDISYIIRRFDDSGLLNAARTGG